MAVVVKGSLVVVVLAGVDVMVRVVGRVVVLVFMVVVSMYTITEEDVSGGGGEVQRKKRNDHEMKSCLSQSHFCFLFGCC